ncbi:S9 family peptidase [Massilia forsythiae]|uniref:S9 family peptidase n=1 Tax=Massilia forsythiae TaxID=2728020 RepID=A0A7Z2VWV8_9BURK|nr:prolyl oligopeptidase family serine peptidase [Massilia forsythiae]QJE00425.1 S9 family peptidase [Massilia forsythiae]
MPFMSAKLRRGTVLAFNLVLALAAHAQDSAAPDVPAPRQATAALPALASFFDNSNFGGALLSPGGRYLAARHGAPGKRIMLAVVDLQTKAVKVVAGFSDADIGHMVWVNDERLAFDVTERDVAPGETYLGAGLYAVNRDGSSLRQLATRRGESFVSEGGTHIQKKILPWHTFLMNQTGAQDSEYLYVTSVDFDERGQKRNVSLLRLNTLTGQATSVLRPATVSGWMLDYQGRPRLAVGAEKGKTTLYYLDPAGDKWRSLASYDSYKGGRNAIMPLGFGPDGTLYVEARGGKDTLALYAFDYASGKIRPEPLVETRGYDFSGQLLGNRARLLGVRYETDAEGSTWFDPALQAMQDKIDKLLPSTINLVSVPSAPDAPWALVRSYSDRQPSVYTLYDIKAGTLDRVGAAHPEIDSRRMGRQEQVRYKARDGLEIPALLTRPAGAAKDAKLPLVMLVHGGPYVRGSTWGWNADSQFLASRGYAVLEPSFRGTTGFGAKHFTAGWKQWGLAMQDDIADGARWAVAQGLADPKRICIAGASYGGYATLMGLARDPDLYRCGVEWAGVTDIGLLYNGHWGIQSDVSDEWKQYGMPELIGDPVKDAAQLEATSPIRQAARIRQPLLLAYGGADQRVPMYHGRQFRDAVSATNKRVEWIEYGDEGHGWSLPAHRIDFWGRVEKFLDKNIGNQAADAPR